MYQRKITRHKFASAGAGEMNEKPLKNDQSVVKRTLCFTVALNLFDRRFSRLNHSRQNYARRFKFEYVCVNKPFFTTLGHSTKWMKVVLTLAALKEGFSEVLFLDGDVECRDCSPNIFLDLNENKTFFMANGFSGRPNAGVVVVRRGAENVLIEILRNRLNPVPREDRVRDDGENGHMIFASKNYEGFSLLDQKWNNNAFVDADDYFRHYSAGPMRETYQFDWKERLAARTSAYFVRSARLLRIEPESLDSLALRVVRRYPVFGTVDSMRALLAEAAPIKRPGDT